MGLLRVVMAHATLEIWKRDLSEKSLESFTEYQKETEDLIP
jgi:hypothetical protein